MQEQTAAVRYGQGDRVHPTRLATTPLAEDGLVGMVNLVPFHGVAGATS